ncbi:hypothetical protein [Staphylococcus phage vB_SauM-V1SA22]|nr:hypothetical protein [Staphylococcus phage vB_SauM-V1SA22]
MSLPLVVCLFSISLIASSIPVKLLTLSIISISSFSDKFMCNVPLE